MFQEITINEFPQVLWIDIFVIKITKINAKVAKKSTRGWQAEVKICP